MSFVKPCPSHLACAYLTLLLCAHNSPYSAAGHSKSNIERKRAKQFLNPLGTTVLYIVPCRMYYYHVKKFLIFKHYYYIHIIASLLAHSGFQNPCYFNLVPKGLRINKDNL